MMLPSEILVPIFDYIARCGVESELALLRSIRVSIDQAIILHNIGGSGRRRFAQVPTAKYCMSLTMDFDLLCDYLCHLSANGTKPRPPVQSNQALLLVDIIRYIESCAAQGDYSTLTQLGLRHHHIETLEELALDQPTPHALGLLSQVPAQCLRILFVPNLLQQALTGFCKSLQDEQNIIQAFEGGASEEMITKLTALSKRDYLSLRKFLCVECKRGRPKGPQDPDPKTFALLERYRQSFAHKRPGRELSLTDYLFIHRATGVSLNFIWRWFKQKDVILHPSLRRDTHTLPLRALAR
ncbi:MAG: STY4526/YPO1902 family pathogenicity island replication protein [Gammaproteobacteria bacterium]